MVNVLLPHALRIQNLKFLHSVDYEKQRLQKLVPYGTVAVASERRRHLANVIAIAKAFAN